MSASPVETPEHRHNRTYGLSRRVLLGGAATAAVGISAAVGFSPLSGRGNTARWDGATRWLNSPPLTSGDLSGSVVAVDFWTFTCINWIRTAPYRRAWWQAYQNDGLVIIGVHTPEFSFERDVDRVRRAAAERGIDYPVAIDNDYAIWRAFDNHYWPALYVLDREGTVRHHRFGEGAYEESERVLQRLLGIDRALVQVEGRGVEAGADWNTLSTPETYVGFGRGTGFASVGGPAIGHQGSYEPPDALSLNQWALDGEWTIEQEKVVLHRAGGTIFLRFHARDAHVVLSSRASGPVPFRVLIDGHPPAASHGVDVAPDGSGILLEGRLYQLVRVQDGVRDRTLQLTFSEPGAEAYSFTFG